MNFLSKKGLHASIIVTYRCNARCNMCKVWENPSKLAEEIKPDLMLKLPNLFFANVTGGEPFVRKDLEDFIEILHKKSRRIVINTNGFFTDRIIQLCERFPEIGLRISIEGLSQANDTIRGIPEGFDNSIRTLFALKELGMKDIGFNITVQDLNYKDLTCLYKLSYALGYEFGTTTVHNSHYFHKWDNVIVHKEEVVAKFKELVELLLRSRKIKEWFRGYFNYGLINYIKGGERLLPCEMGQDGFFIDPFGDVLACNGMDKKETLGNIKEQPWDEIWHGKRADEVREMVGNCTKQCWMIGSAAPAIWHHPAQPIKWVAKNKLRSLLGKGVYFE
jgi:Fe-coproporphyrin III synthase